MATKYFHMPRSRWTLQKITKICRILAASSDGDQKVTFRAGDGSTNVTVQDWGGFVGQRDTQIWKPAPDKVTLRGFGQNANPPREVPLRKDWAVSANHAAWDLSNRGTPNWSPTYPNDYEGLRPGYIKRADIAWYVSHHHTASGLNEPYAYSYLFAYAINLPSGAKSLTLPANDKVKILAITAVEEPPAVRPTQPLYDTLGGEDPGPMLAASSK